MTAVQHSWIRFLASEGYGWEDIAARCKRNGETIPDADIRAIVIKRGKSCTSS